jgi:hypothetical protein
MRENLKYRNLDMGFEVLTAMVVKSSIVWDKMKYSLWKSNISEEYTSASIFSVEEQANQGTSKKQPANFSSELRK